MELFKNMSPLSLGLLNAAGGAFGGQNVRGSLGGAFGGFAQGAMAAQQMQQEQERQAQTLAYQKAQMAQMAQKSRLASAAAEQQRQQRAALARMMPTLSPEERQLMALDPTGVKLAELRVATAKEKAKPKKREMTKLADDRYYWNDSLEAGKPVLVSPELVVEAEADTDPRFGKNKEGYAYQIWRQEAKNRGMSEDDLLRADIAFAQNTMNRETTVSTPEGTRVIPGLGVQDILGGAQQGAEKVPAKVTAEQAGRVAIAQHVQDQFGGLKSALIGDDGKLNRALAAELRFGTGVTEEGRYWGGFLDTAIQGYIRILTGAQAPAEDLAEIRKLVAPTFFEIAAGDEKSVTAKMGRFEDIIQNYVDLAAPGRTEESVTGSRSGERDGPKRYKYDAQGNLTEQ